MNIVKQVVHHQPFAQLDFIVQIMLLTHITNVQLATIVQLLVLLVLLMLLNTKFVQQVITVHLVVQHQLNAQLDFIQNHKVQHSLVIVINVHQDITVQVGLLLFHIQLSPLVHQ